MRARRGAAQVSRYKLLLKQQELRQAPPQGMPPHKLMKLSATLGVVMLVAQGYEHARSFGAGSALQVSCAESLHDARLPRPRVA